MIPSLETGAMLGGDPVGGPRYRVRTQIGAGGFGLTYLCDDLRMGGPVVVKEFAPTGLAERRADGTLGPSSTGGSVVRLDRLLARFRDEAQTLARVSRSSRSPHLVQVIDKWDERGTCYYAMTLIEASGHWPVREDTGRIGADTWRRIERIAHELLDALETVHDAGILCHGDLKPANVLLDERDRAVLIDFGTVRTDADVVRTSATVMVTPGWAAPELQHRDHVKEAGPWSDLYAWALLVWGAAVGHPTTAHDEDTGREVPWPIDASARGLRIARTGLASDPYAHAGTLTAVGVPPAWAAALVRCLSLSVEDRPQSVAELRAMLLAEPPRTAPGLTGPAATTRTMLDTELPATGPASVSHTTSDVPPPVPMSLAHPTPPPTASPARRVPWVRAAIVASIVILVAVGAGLFLDRSARPTANEAASAEATPDDTARADSEAIATNARDAVEATTSAAAPTAEAAAEQERDAALQALADDLNADAGRTLRSLTIDPAYGVAFQFVVGDHTGVPHPLRDDATNTYRMAYRECAAPLLLRDRFVDHVRSASSRDGELRWRCHDRRCTLSGGAHYTTQASIGVRQQGEQFVLSSLTESAPLYSDAEAARQQATLDQLTSSSCADAERTGRAYVVCHTSRDAHPGLPLRSAPTWRSTLGPGYPTWAIPPRSLLSGAQMSDGTPVVDLGGRAGEWWYVAVPSRGVSGWVVSVNRESTSPDNGRPTLCAR